MKSSTIKLLVKTFKYVVILFFILNSRVEARAGVDNQNFHILILNTDDEDYQATNILTNTFRKEIQNQKVDIAYTFENLNHYLYFENTTDALKLIIK